MRSGNICLRICFLAAAMAAGCGGVEGAGSEPKGIAVFGTVKTPSGMTLGRNADRMAQAMGFKAAASVAVEAYRIDDAGRNVGSKLASTTTNADGVYSLRLPMGIESSSDIVMVAGSGNDRMRSIIHPMRVDINPLTELVVSKIVESGYSLTDFSLEEIDALMTQVEQGAADMRFDCVDSVVDTLHQLESSTLSLSLDQTIASAGSGRHMQGSGMGSGRRIAFDQDVWDDWDDDDEEEEEDPFGNILEVSYAVIENVVRVAPIACEPVAVSAHIELKYQDETASIRSAELVYSANGGSQLATILTDLGGGAWSGEIPGHPVDTTVDYYIRVIDTNNNVTSGAIPTMKVATVDDIDNSVDDIHSDDADILGVAASYDAENLYVNFNVQGKVDGGTIDPPYLREYVIKVTNPDAESTEDTEGLLVGKWWRYLPLMNQKEVQERFLPLFLGGQDYVEKFGQEDIDNMIKERQIVFDIGKMMSGNTMESLLFQAKPTANVEGGEFSGSIKRAPLGENPSGFYRIIAITLANRSLDSFMPIPLNCSNFLTLYTSSYSYTVQ